MSTTDDINDFLMIKIIVLCNRKDTRILVIRKTDISEIDKKQEKLIDEKQPKYEKLYWICL